MSDTFILGAGFSRALGGNEMPLTSDLGVELVPGYIENLGHYEDFLLDGRLPVADVEEWLSSIAEPQPYRDRADNLRARALFTEIVRCLADDIRQRENTVRATKHLHPDWLSTLVTRWHDTKATVITFNYDTLIESALPGLEIAKNQEPGSLTYMWLRPGLIPFWAVMYGGMRMPPEQTFALLKLHGSLNWYWDPDGVASPVDVGVDEGWGTAKATTTTELRHRAPGLEPLIAPPTTGKTPYFGPPIMREMWRLALEALDAASEVYALGYSFPKADATVLRAATKFSL